MEKYVELEDEELVCLFRNGDLRAFETLVLRYNPLFVGYGQKDWRGVDVEVQVQEMWRKAYSNIQRLKEPKRFRGWCAAILTNLLRDAARKAAKEKEERSKFELVRNESSWPSDSKLEAAEFRHVILSKLSERHRWVIELCLEEGPETELVKKIVGKFGVTPSGARTILSRARAAVKKIVDGRQSA